MTSMGVILNEAKDHTRKQVREILFIAQQAHSWVCWRAGQEKVTHVDKEDSHSLYTGELVDIIG
jgi:hypothetical protein